MSFHTYSLSLVWAHCIYPFETSSLASLRWPVIGSGNSALSFLVKFNPNLCTIVLLEVSVYKF